MENLCTKHLTVIAFMVRDMALSVIFSIFPLAEQLWFMNIKMNVLQDINYILCFNFQVWLHWIYVYVKVNGATPLSLRILLVYQGLKFKGLSDTFFKGLYGLLRLSNKNNIIVGREVLTPPILCRAHYIVYSHVFFFVFFLILSNPLLFPCHLQPPPHCCFCCLASLAEWVIMPHLVCYFTQ